MPGENCLVCASDEGIFLDVLDQPTLRVKAKNCRLDKVSEDGPSTKVCYKCAFEIEQCNIFVEKIKKANKIQNSRKSCCIFCLDAYNKEIFFDLTKQKFGVNNLIQRIQDLFPDELKYKELQRHLICLSCRYCVDLLIDLRNLSDEIPAKLKTIIQNGIDPADLPKTKTSIVNRKTTFIQSSNLDLNTPSDTDSDSSVIMSNRKRKNKVNKTIVSRSQRKCEQCKIEVKSGVDMYKIYRTGVTVCKQCWLTIDPGKVKTSSKKRKKFDYSGTKLCSVLLEDVYQKNSYEREYKIEKDNKGNTVFIVTDDSESESRTKRKVNKIKSNDINNKQDVSKEVVHDIEIKKVKSVRGGRRKEDVEKSMQETVDNKPTRLGNRRKESEPSLQEVEVKSTRSRRHKDSEQSVREESELKSIKSSIRRKDSEESIHEDGEDKFTKDYGSLKDDEQSIHDNTEFKSTKMIRRRKESEESSQDIEIRLTRSSQSRKDSEQSIQEVLEVKPVSKSFRQRKESDHSSQEFERKANKSNKNRDSEHSSQDGMEIINARGFRRRKESDQSIQEDIEVNVDIDSDSAPVSKKAKTSSPKVESMPKHIQSNINNQNSAASEIVFTRKRGRSSSLESTDSVRKSSRSARKNTLELEEIIEIDVDDSNSFKIQKENVSLNEELMNKGILIQESKRNRTERAISYDNHSDVESNASDRKVSSKRSSSVSSKESTPVLQFKAPHNKDNQENLESLKFTLKETKSNRFVKIQKFEIGKSDDVESLKSIEVDTSESEEIDVLKSTDEETKDDTLKVLMEEKDKSKSPILEEDDVKLDKVAIRLIDDDMLTSVDEDNSNDISEKNLMFNTNDLHKIDHRRDYKSVKQNIIDYENEKYLQKSENESIEENIIITNIDNVKKDMVEEIYNDIEKDIVASDINDIETNVSEDYSDHSMPESLKDKYISSKQLLSYKFKSRKSKFSSNKKSRKSKNKDSSDDIIVYDSSDSEVTKFSEQVNITYTCTICDKIYENKFIGLQHELTHMKTLEIKLKKVQIPNPNKSFNESDIELQISSKDNTFHSDSTDEVLAIDQNEEKNENIIKIKEQILKGEKHENNIDNNKKEEAIDEQIIKVSSLTNINIDTTQNNHNETSNTLNEVEESIERTRIEKETKINDIDEEKVELIKSVQGNEVEDISKQPIRKLSKKSEAKSKSDKKSRGKRKIINENVELEREMTSAVEIQSDKIAEAVQETLNDMAELHVKIQESNPVKVPELNKILNSDESEIEKKNEITELETINEDKNENPIMQLTEKKECGSTMECDDAIQREIMQSEKVICETVNEGREIVHEMESSSTDVLNESFKEAAVDLEVKVMKEPYDEIIDKSKKVEDDEAESIKDVANLDSQIVDIIADNVECKLSKSNGTVEIEEAVDLNGSDRENECIIDSPTDVNVESGTEIDNAMLNRLSVEKDDICLGQDNNETVGVTNEADGNNTEDEEALAQESLEELMQRGGLQIIDELAESVTDGDEESEKDVNLSSEKENVTEKEIEIDNELQIKISDAECTEILEISNKSLSKQKEVDNGVLGENQIIQDVDVVEEVINDDEQPHGNVVQEVEVESNGNCVNVANNVVSQALTDVFNMATVDISKRLDLQTDPISDEETEVIPETVENISREIRNSQDMPSLDPIDEINDD
ncbi:PREDICTED: MATH and LRR domain-containing protein PFE0570w-like [Ceratosolen solmsi marchali]|uniref:MATH and LRR domain-containing protein PFE0570w-like n=1 Tax=Ceratosolen solmsi marchali TaxID=326594 RepID=A0AAJ6YPR7_9HYME|nr:PREDICTED: MATH and LRR domain-containing protein PFE0570w-like [Ceratosolen solmsi marchali]